MKRSAKFLTSLKPAALAALTVLLVLGAGAAFPGLGEPGPRKDLPGQTATLLPDGIWLLLGGDGGNGPVAAGFLWNEATGAMTQLPTRMKYARAFHTATVLADGTVAIIGGRGSKGTATVPVEIFKPEKQSFTTLLIRGNTARSHHSATLLTDGEVLIVGGRSSSGKTLDDAQLWNPRTNNVESISSRLDTPRSGHHAALASDGNVLIQGGVDSSGHKLSSSESFDSTKHIFTPLLKDQSKADVPSSSGSEPSPTLAGSIPVAGATNVPTTSIISLRFSEPMQVETVTAQTVTLDGPNGGLAVTVVPAEGGMLAFINPDSELAPSAQYTVTVDGAVARDGSDMAKASFTFTTGSTGGTSGGGGSGGSPGSSGNDSVSNAAVWTPTSDWRTHLPPSPWQSLPPLRAPAGVTALSGQVLTIDGSPLPEVTLQVGNRSAKTDNSGRFLIPGLDAGNLKLDILGSSANNGGKTFGLFEVGVGIAARVTNVLPFTIWMPVLDTVHAITIPVPTRQETVATNPLVPGLELHIASNTVIRDVNGNTVNTITITPVPLDRPPFPLPAGVDVPIYFTVQPGLAKLEKSTGGYSGAWLVYPNLNNLPVGSPFNFWNYDADNSGWYVYGKGKVASGGKQILPDPDVQFYEFSGAMVGNSGEPPQTGSKDNNNADPVDSSTGIFRRSETDFHISDVIPIDFQRTYLSQDGGVRPFGIGATDNYEIFITQHNNNLYTKLDLILSDGEQVNYINTNSDTGNFGSSHFVPTRSSNPTYYGSTITWNGTGWNLTLKDGTIYAFPDSTGNNNPAAAALISISDRVGNKLTITRDSTGNITQITSPNGRWVQFQHDTSNRITQATDVLGRNVTYTYNNYTATGRPTCSSTGMLCAVTDPAGGVTSYSYDGGNRMLTVSDPRGNKPVTNTFDATSGRVTNQVLADGTSNYQFVYTVNGNGQITQTKITDPNGAAEVKIFDGNGFVTSDVYASGSSVAQTYSYTRDPNSELTTGMTDGLGRQFSYGYDTFQMNNYLGQPMTLTHANLLSVTCSNCLSQSIATSMTYDPTFNQLTSVTDPLTHAWTLGHDSLGNLTSITDPLNHQVTLGYNFQGQLTSVTDAVSDMAKFTYVHGDLATITDPAGATFNRFTDDAGRLLSMTDALGNLTGYTYDNLDRMTQITDPNNGFTKFSYDGNGNLLSVTDALNNQTSYAYDSRNRALTRQDALLKTDTYVYDGNSNITQYTDRRSKITTLQYDALNRRTFAGFGTVSGHKGNTYESTINYTWDAGNRARQALDSLAGTVNRSWDGLNRLTQEVTPQGTINYTYDNANRRATMQVVGQTGVNYCWDSANRLTGVSQQSCPNSPTVGIAYDNANRRTTLTLPNGVTVGYTFDNDSRVTGLTYNAGSTNLGNLTYAYDPDGRRTTIGGSLAAVALPANVSGGTSTVYNSDNSQTKFNGTSHVFDAAGNMTSDGTNTYTFDGRNHLTAISGGVTASFVYDGFGRRMKKVVAGSMTQFLNDGFNPVQELNGATPPSATANLLTGLGIDEYFTRKDSSNSVSTLLQDALGSTIGLVGSAQTISTSYTYQPFGAVTTGGSASSNSYQFAGREYDGTGLFYYRARYYHPTFQRFLAQDPIGFDGGDPNLYVYAGNQPSDFIDPFGLSDIEYNAGQGIITIYDGNGNVVGVYAAGNNAQSGSRGPWPEGIYDYSYHTTHPDDSPNSAYGSNGNYVFNVPGCVGCGIHSGRLNLPDRLGRTGPRHATNGCIRTTDQGTATIQGLINQGDPPQTLTVVR